MSGGVIEATSSTRRAAHMDGERIRAYFGRYHQIEDAEVLESIAREVVPMDIPTAGDLVSKVAYVNHRNVARYGGEVLTKEESDIAVGEEYCGVMHITSWGSGGDRKLRGIHDNVQWGQGGLTEDEKHEGTESDFGDGV